MSETTAPDDGLVIDGDADPTLIDSTLADTPPSGRRQPPINIVLYALTIAALALWAMSSELALATSDALLPSLMSTQHWTLFYWGQDRLANLVPLVAMPVRDELQNFYLQSWIFGVAFFAAVALIVAVQANDRLRRAPVLMGLVISASGVVTTTVVFTPHTAYTFVFEQVYAISGVLYVVGVSGVLARRRVANVGGALSTLAAMLINPSASLFLPLALVTLPFDAEFKRRALRLTAVTVATLGLAWLTMRLFPAGTSSQGQYSSFSPSRAANEWRDAWRQVRQSFARGAAPIFAISVVIQLGSWRRLTPICRRLCIAVPVYAFVWFWLFTANQWVTESNNFRYFFPIHATVVFFVCGAIVQVTQWLCTPRLLGIVSAPAAVVLACAAAFSLMSIGALRVADGIDIDSVNAAQPDAAAAGDHHAQLIIGGYWAVWPAVIVARDQGRDVFGVTHRDDPLRGEITALANDAVRDAGRLLVVCTGMPTDECAAILSDRTGRTWTVDQVIQQSPVVVALRPVP